MEVTAARFEELVADALDDIPEELATLIDNVVVIVDDSPSRRLLGLYEGVPLTARGAGYGIGGGMPDRIRIFRHAICAICRTEEDVRHQVRVTVIHEVAHHFGIDDRRLEELGWG